MNFKDKSSANRFLWTAGFVGLLIMTSFHFCSPYAIESRKLKDKAEKLRKEIQLVRQEKLPSLEREKRSLKEVEENYEKILRKIELAEKRIPSTENLGGLLEELNRIAKEEKVDFIQVKFKEAKDLNKYIKLPVEISLKCSLEKLVLYLDGIEKLPRLVRVNFIKITADKDNGLNLDIFLGAESYVLKES